MTIEFSRLLRLRPIRLSASSFALTILLSGCQSMEAESLVTSSAPPEISGPAASAIAGDMVSRFAEQIGPGKATVALKSDTSPFGQAWRRHSRVGDTQSLPTRDRPGYEGHPALLCDFVGRRPGPGPSFDGER